jgi:hypothetical protein
MFDAGVWRWRVSPPSIRIVSKPILRIAVRHRRLERLLLIVRDNAGGHRVATSRRARDTQFRADRP